MKPVSRKEVESLLSEAGIISSDVKQDEHEIRIVFQLQNQQSCEVRYDLEARTKEYLLGEPGG